MDKLPLLDLDFRTTYVEGNVLYTPSKGSLVTRAVMGTGVVGNGQAPTITPIGASFDGVDYLNTSSKHIFSATSPHSIVVRGRFFPSAGTQHLISNYDGDAPMLVVRYGSAYTQFWMRDNLSRSIDTYAPPPPAGIPTTLVFSYEGNSVPAGQFVYYNGKDVTTIRSGSSLQGSVLSSASYNIGRHPTGSEYLSSSTSIRRFQIYPFCMSPAQVRAIHEKFEREGEA